jgi:hypothetical protein
MGYLSVKDKGAQLLWAVREAADDIRTLLDSHWHFMLRRTLILGVTQRLYIIAYWNNLPLPTTLLGINY